MSISALTSHMLTRCHTYHARVLGLLHERQPRLFRPLLDACVKVQSHWRGFKVTLTHILKPL